MRNNQGNHNRRVDEYSLPGESSLDSGFVINPENESVSIITDEFEPSISSEVTDDTPLAQIIGRFSFFGGKKKSPQQPEKDKRTLSKNSRVSFDPSIASPGGDIFADNPIEIETDKEGFFEVSIDMDALAKTFRERPGKSSGVAIDLANELQGSLEARDFTKDEPRDMTFGRRVALSFMSNQWYNPSARKVQPMKGPNPAGSVGAQKNSKGGPSLERAWGYFEHVTLPRYITGDFRGGCCERAGLLRAKLEKAEPGELYLKSKLYDPIFTALDQMGDFGLGFGLYLAALRAAAIVTFCAGLVSVPNMLYFSGPKYSNKQEGVYWALKGSAICTDLKYVPCVNCTDAMFSQDGYRLRNILNSDGVELPFALKNNCDGAKITAGLFNLASAFVIIFGMVVASYYLKSQEVGFDEDEQTAQDYSIKVFNPPPDAYDPNEWKTFFRRKFGVQVMVCTIATNNQDLVNKLVHRREVLQKIKSIVGPNISLENNNVKKMAIDITARRNLLKKGLTKIFPGIPELFADIQKCEEDIKELSSRDRDVTQVFITFETEAAQRKVLSIMKTKDGYDPKYCFRGEFLNVGEPAEPSSIRWGDLDDSLATTQLRLTITTGIAIGLIVAVAFLVREVRTFGATYAAFTISILNVIFPHVAKFLTNIEIHQNEGSKQTSLYMKIVLFRWVITAVVTTVITPFTSTIMDGDDHLLAGIYAIFFAEIVTSTGLQLLDISGNLKRHYFAPRAKTQEDMNECMSGCKVELAERYSNMTKIFFLALWYSPIYPGALFLCSLSLFINYYVDRFSLMRSWTPAPKLSSVISRINRLYFLPASLGIMAIISSYTWTQFSFDNLCPVELPENYVGTWTIPKTDSSSETIEIVDDSFQSYKYCNQNLLDLGTKTTFPALPIFQPPEEQWMTDDQERLTHIWGWTSVGILGFIVFLFSISIKKCFTETYEPRGADTKIPFTDVTNIRAYIPEVRSPEIPYPLVACPVSLVQDDLFAWSSPYHDYSYYDLTLDAEKVMKGDEKGRSVSETAFSKVVHWIPAPYDS